MWWEDLECRGVVSGCGWRKYSFAIIKGIGLLEWCVTGRPVFCWSISSALPWSAVIIRVVLCSCVAVKRVLRQLSTTSIALIAAVRLPVCATISEFAMLRRRKS